MKVHLRTIEIALIPIAFILVMVTLHFPFYWDNIVQLSLPAHYYFETNFATYYLPNDIATGHFPLAGMYFGFLWKVFGRSLAVAHWGMLPFVFGLLWQLKRFLVRYTQGRGPLVALTLFIILLDATFLSQISLITFEVIQLFFFFLVLNEARTKRKWVLALGFAGLMLISLRGAMMGIGLMVFWGFRILFFHDKKLRSVVIWTLPGWVLFGALLWHFRWSNGWMIHNTVSGQWAQSSSLADGRGVMKNLGVVLWRFLDFGRVVLFGGGLWLIWERIRKKYVFSQEERNLLGIVVGQLVVFLPIVLLSQNSISHRYFLHVILLLMIFSVVGIFKRMAHHRWFFIFAIMGLVAGHFVVYPLHISQGWDCTTQHWNYFSAEDQMYKYIQSQGIQPEEVATFFPARRSRYHTHLNAGKSWIYGGRMFDSKYIMYSNAFNPEDSVLERLLDPTEDWRVIHEEKRGEIFVWLMKKGKSL